MKGHRLAKSTSIALVLMLAVALMVFGASCSKDEKATGNIGVVVTILPLADFVENVGGEKIDVIVMVPPGADPHAYEPTTRQMVELSEAEIYVKVGSGVEFEVTWMDKIIEQNKDMLVVDCARGIELIEMVVDEDEVHGGDDHHHHGGMDPHIWLSPLNAKVMVENIYEGLVEVDTENAAYYAQNRDEYLAELDQLDKDVEEGLSGIENRRFIVFHPAWGYFAQDYDLEQIAVEIEGKEPSGKDIAHLIEEALENEIKVVFASPQFDAKSAEVIAEEIDGVVLYIDPLAEDYVDNMYVVLGYMVQAME